VANRSSLSLDSNVRFPLPDIQSRMLNFSFGSIFTVQREIQNITPSRSEIGMTLVIPEASHSGGSTSGCCHLWRLQFRLFRKSQRVIDLDPEVAHRAFELSMPEQELHSPQIPRQFIDQGRFGPPK